MLTAGAASQGRLVAPFGTKGTAIVGGFYQEIAETAERQAADAFVAWLRREVPRGVDVVPALHAGRPFRSCNHDACDTTPRRRFITRMSD